MNMDDVNDIDDDDFQDGWDDDDVDNLDLDDDDDDDDDDDASEGANQNTRNEIEDLPVESKGVQLGANRRNDNDALSFLNAEVDTTIEGWDEDEDTLLDEIESSSQIVKDAVPVPVPIVSVAPKKPTVPTSTNTRSTSSIAAAPSLAEAENEVIQTANEGWGDDDDDDLFSEESESTAAHENNAPAVTAQPPHQAEKVASTLSSIEMLVAESSSFSGAESSNDDADEAEAESDGWDDDADLIFDNIKEQEPEPRNNMPPIETATRQPPKSPPKPAPPPTSALYTALEDYLLQLPRLQSSINAVLEYECNTVEKANELVQYYSERPGLTAYTIEKELPRMEYALLQGPSTNVVTDKKEIAKRLHQDSTSLVSRCANQSLLADLLQVFTGSDLLVRPQFMAAALAQSCRFRLDLSQSLVQVQAQLDLCLPTENGRWKVAELLIRIDFCSQPSKPFIKYQLEAIRPVVRPNDPAWTLQLHGVCEMLGHLDLGDDNGDDAMHQASPPAAMDNNFRDVFLQQSQSLFQNSAVGIKSAWQEIDTVAGFSNKLSRLPRFDGFDDVMQAAEAQPTSWAHQERPTSILGGFFGKLAKSVALPDEDPSMYQDWQAPAQAAPSAQPMLYNRSPAPSAPLLYKKDTPPPPQLYNKMTPAKPVQPAVQEAPKLYNETPGRPPRGPPQLAPPQPPSQPPSAPTSTSALTHVEPQAAPVPSEPEGAVEDGWDDDLDLDVADDESVSEPPVASPPKLPVTEQQPVPAKLAPPPIDDDKNGNGDWVYNPANDIIPTRKRWVNPRPGSRQLRSFAVQ